MVQHNNFMENESPPGGSQKAWSLSLAIPEIQLTPKHAIETPQKGPHVTEAVFFRKYSRRFVDPALEHEYTLHLADKNIRIQKIAIGFAVLMMIVALFVDFVPPFAEYNWLFRIVDSISLICITIAFILLFFKRLRIHSQTIIVISLTYYALAIMIDAIWFDNDPQAGFSSATILVMVLICRLKFWISFVSCSFISVSHLMLSIIHSHAKYSPQAIIAYPFGILATSSVCLYCSYYLDTMLRHAFLNNSIMTLEEYKLSELRVRVDSLLNNIFPPVLRQKIQELKQQKQDGADEMGLICDEHADVTVLMADIVGFTTLSSHVSPQQIVEMLNTVFTMFDDIMDDLGMEKIRTLGDAYLCVSNMTYKKRNHQDLAVQAARRMISSLPKLNDEFKLDPPLALRIGIASGPVISGVTGLSKWNYDIFGRTVMDAFTMEASSEPLCITVTEHVFRSLKESAGCFTPIAPGRTDAYTYAVNDNINNMLKVAPIKPIASIKSNKSRVSVTISEDQNIARDIIAKSEFYQAQQREALQQTRRYSSDLLDIKELTGPESESRTIINRAQSELFAFSQRKVLRLLRFADKGLERQYSDTIAQNSQVYTFRLTLVSIIPFVLWTLSDVMSSRFPLKEMPISIWITDAVLIIMAAVFALFCKSSLFLRPLAIPVNALYVCAAGCILAAQQYIDPKTVYHAYHPYLITFICFQYIRMKQVLSVASGMVVVIVSLAIFVLSRFTGSITQGDNFTHLILYGTVVFMAGATNYLLELGLRREFLSDLILKKSLEEQEIGNRQAKLLLYNIIPRQIAYKLHQNTGTVVDFFPNATMGFATLLIGDLASRPMEMFLVLNEIFTVFDKLVLDQECEKIKTINTTYMVVSGLPKARNDHAQNALRLATRMFDVLDRYQCPYKDPRTGAPYQIRLRVGVASGPVVAGVIGKAKYAYDCWSDITNTASRMESNGIEGYVQTTSSVFEMAYPQFPDLQKRDEIMQIKGKGTMQTYLLKCI